MIPLSTPSVSDSLSFDEVIARLKASPHVDGVAAFGSRATDEAVPSSDFDLLILVHSLPARVFQMVTSIAGRLADIVLVEVSTADAILQASEPPEPRSFEGLFVRKMQTAHILYNASGRLQRVQQMVLGLGWVTAVSPERARDQYAAWFWQSFALLHLERLSRSQEPISLTAFDMMLTSCLPGAWRAYFDVRGIAWDGEKAALRYWATHEPDYLRVVRECLASGGRERRLGAYRELVALTLAPVGPVFGKGETAVILSDPAADLAEVDCTLQYWNALFD